MVDREARFESVVAEVYEPLQRFLRRRARPEDVDELLNDALLVIWRRLDDVPWGDIQPWTYGVAKRCLANHHRGDRRRRRLVSRAASHPAPGPPDLDPTPGEVENPILAAALADLGDDERELVRLWAWEQLEPREIAIVLDTTPNAVSLRLTRVRKKLVRALERQDAQPAGHERFGHGREVES